jgi:hypothetical protein
MKNRFFYLALAGLIASTMALAVYFLKIDEQDRKEYASLLSVSNMETNTPGKSRQDKQGIVKEMWLKKGEKWLHVKMRSASSALTYRKEQGKTELVEEMKDLVALIQDDWEEEWQNVRVIRAKEATYHFKGDRLEARHVELEQHKLDGHELPDKPPESDSALMCGEAQSVEFDFSGHMINLKAEHLKAKVNQL